MRWKTGRTRQGLGPESLQYLDIAERFNTLLGNRQETTMVMGVRLQVSRKTHGIRCFLNITEL